VSDLVVAPVGPERWEDLVALFGENGAYSNCWCTWFLLSGKDFTEAGNEGRRDLLADMVAEGREPGLLAYRDGEPVGWCAVGPRHWYARMTSPRARVYRAFDEAPAWVVNCFYVRRDQRGGGVAAALLDAAVAHARSRGATIVEGYPVDQDIHATGPAELFVGTLSMFQRAGFHEVARMGSRPLVRRVWTPPSS
jgi:GNAT superfamily N-acetyltransferase